MCAVATGSLLGVPRLRMADCVTLTGTKDGATAAGAFMLPTLIEEVLQSAGLLEYETRLNDMLPKFFVPPDQFLLEIRERRSARQSARMAS